MDENVGIDPNERDESESSNVDKESDAAKYLERRKEREADLTEEEISSLRQSASILKESGNNKFKEEDYTGAIEQYTEALEQCPLVFEKDRAVMFSNRAAAHLHQENLENVLEDCTNAITLHPAYVKPLLRRAQTYERKEKLDEALEDYKKVLELDPNCQDATSACHRLPAMINERNEKLKTEMMGKLKDLGNLVLRPFGLSTDNFQFNQNDGGGYSVNFVNNSNN